MHEILHFIGLCPDSLSHIDLIDIFICHHNQFINIVNTILKWVK